ncbi:putative glutamine ABC transporter permease protein GlnM [compost metagenome]
MLSLPGPRASLEIGQTFFLNSRGLYMPAPSPSDSFVTFFGAVVVAIIGIVLLTRWSRARFEATGRYFPVSLGAIPLLLVLPGLAVLLTGNPLQWSTPELTGFNFRGGWVLIPELIALTLALSIYTAAFIAENVRSGIMAVSHGQTEAARSLGMPAGKTLRLVIIPQAMRVIIPPLTSQYLNLAKNSSLAAGIGYPDMVSLFAGTVLNQTGQAIEVIAITMSVYLAISISISMLMNWYNKRMALIER